MRIFSRNKDWHKLQEKFFFTLEKIVNIALVKTERRDNQSVKEILKNLGDIFRRFWQLRKEKPDDFNALLWSKDFFENYIRPLKRETMLDIEDSEGIKNVEELRQEAGLLLSFFPDRELKGLTQFLNSFTKIWECAVRNNNEEISRFTVYHIIGLLEEVTQEPSNHLIVEQFLKLLNYTTWKGIKNSQNKELDISVYSASFQWYIEIVFNMPRQKDRCFDLSYLKLFDRYFFSSVRYIVSERQTSLFHHLVKALVDGVHIPYHYGGRVWDYKNLATLSKLKNSEILNEKHEISNRIKELENSINDLYTKDKLEDYLLKFNELKKILEPHFGKEQQEEAKQIEEEIIEFAVMQYKYNNLLENAFAIGAFCLFKNRSDYIKYLWEFKQPPDSDASWTGHDIMPNTLNDIIIFYFRKQFFDKRFIFWEGHHGSERYYKQYLLLLLARVLQNLRPSGIDLQVFPPKAKYEQIENYHLPDLHVNRVYELKNSIDNLIEISRNLKKKEEILLDLDLDKGKFNELFDTKLVTFLKNLKIKAQKRIEHLKRTWNISLERVDEFKDKVLEGFNKSAILRDVFKYYGLHEDKIQEKYEGEIQRIGINIIDEKEAFFDDWFVFYRDWGTNYGEDLASGENSVLVEKIAQNCREIKEDQFENKLDEFENLSDVIILAAFLTIEFYFDNSNKFKPQWKRDCQQLPVKGFAGFYKFRGINIPVFATHHRKSNKQIFILYKSRLGKLVQYSPFNEGEDENLLREMFYMNIQSFSENSKLMDRYIKNPPNWLQEIGDEQKQREYLQEHVLIHIFERFDYETPNFKGFKLKLAN